MYTVPYPYQCCEIIQAKIKVTPKIGIILGSGLGGIAEKITNQTNFAYSELPGFPVSSVEGHSGQLIIGELGKNSVACLQGRAHFYEGITAEAIKTMVRTLKCLGCTTVIITNAAGYLHSDIQPGSLMLITDHINFQGTNPLIGPNDDEFGSRFYPMTNAYNHGLQQQMIQTANNLDINLVTGIYISVTGPMYETPAEIQAFRKLGADAVGMSTVAEVQVARHCGLKVVAISAITNLAAGLSKVALSHEETLHHGKLAAKDLERLILGFLEQTDDAC